MRKRNIIFRQFHRPNTSRRSSIPILFSIGLTPFFVSISAGGYPAAMSAAMSAPIDVPDTPRRCSCVDPTSDETTLGMSAFAVEGHSSTCRERIVRRHEQCLWLHRLPLRDIHLTQIGRARDQGNVRSQRLSLGWIAKVNDCAVSRAPNSLIWMLEYWLDRPVTSYGFDRCAAPAPPSRPQSPVQTVRSTSTQHRRQYAPPHPPITGTARADHRQT